MKSLLAFHRAVRAASGFDAAAQIVIRTLSTEIEARQPSAGCTGGFLQLRCGQTDRSTVSGGPMQVSATLRRAAEAGAAVLAVQANTLCVQSDGFARGELLDGRSAESRSLLSQAGVQFVLGIPLRLAPGPTLGVVAIALTLEDPPTCLAPLVDDLEGIAALALDTLLAQPSDPASAENDLPARSAMLDALLSQLQPFAELPEPIVLVGPPGRSQPMLADWCHRRSRRPGLLHHARFDLREQRYGIELFGWTSPPVPGAAASHPGLLSMARKGTIFIDDIERMPMSMQGRLVGALTDGRYLPFGAGQARRCDARLIFGLQNLSAASALHPHLWQRIGWARFPVPPMHDRAEELFGWADWFIRQAAKHARLDPQAAPMLERHWAQGLITLESVMRRALALARSEHAGDGPLTVRADQVRRSLNMDATHVTALRSAMRNAAAQFVEVAEARGQGALTLRHAEAFAGDVLQAAVTQLGKREAFTLLGREAELERDNHHRTARRYAKRVGDLEQLLTTNRQT